ncbi:acyl-CoA dehydrogenase family protein [Amycolatopsis suaedae]|uniref:Acyl-CoA dehydrogenase n=1 Tax=Amycolatopsis suaedae TaxID=2510978 RepID=A0A4Q7J430_9PSEU|nr:acyl-CoA dehydrogenase family protein [Amycolatopsis suaedae]RZQ61103.1 acyl-CoA dehydrogenase [Amycolatopsis suaedae]
MDFTLTDDQVSLVTAARDYLTRAHPATADRSTVDTQSWPELLRQGWLDPGLGVVERALLAEEGGRALHPAPWWPAAAALPLHAADGPVALVDAVPACRAVVTDGRWSLYGAAAGVTGADTAAELVVAARTPAGPAVFAVPVPADGVAVVTGTGIDPLRPPCDVAFAGAAARPLVTPPDAAAALTAARRHAAVLLCCEAVGVADAALRLAVEHAGDRVQFDRPIGSFQAVAHQLAEAYADVELARSLAYRAACALAASSADLADALACAAHACPRAAVSVAETAVQVCGGMGVTWEFPLHRRLRRALWTEATLAGEAAGVLDAAGLLR